MSYFTAIDSSSAINLQSRETLDFQTHHDLTRINAVPREEPFLSVRARVSSLARIRKWLDETLSGFGLPDSARSDLALVVTELCTNIIRHGYRGKPGPIELGASQNHDSVIVTITDRAPVFAPRQRETPGANGLLREGGYGLGLIRKLTDDISHHELDGGGNRVTLIKRRQP
jgi:sigma-B regulation protein RsbU (phosphoserine phosphatase)